MYRTVISALAEGPSGRLIGSESTFHRTSHESDVRSRATAVFPVAPVPFVDWSSRDAYSSGEPVVSVPSMNLATKHQYSPSSEGVTLERSVVAGVFPAVTALSVRTIPGDGTAVEEYSLWTSEEVLITPHNAGHTPAHWDRLADVVGRHVERVVASGTYSDLENQVQP